jgi:glycosyl transferase, family 25
MAPHLQAPSNRPVDGVLVINLDHRPERLERFTQNAAAHSALANWERITAINGQNLPGYGQKPWFRDGTRDKGWAGRAGCTLSHRQAIATAQARGWRSVLIFEDDVEFGPDFDRELQAALHTLNTRSPSWHICFLGVSKPIGPGLIIAPLGTHQHLFEIFGCIGAFAYIVKAEVYDWALARLPEAGGVWPWVARHRAIDRWFARNLTPRFNITAVSPSLVGHYTSFSDIGQRAGAVISKNGAAEDHSRPFVGCSRLVFACKRIQLRIVFIIAGYVNHLRAWLKRLRGF